MIQQVIDLRWGTDRRAPRHQRERRPLPRLGDSLEARRQQPPGGGAVGLRRREEAVVDEAASVVLGRRYIPGRVHWPHRRRARRGRSACGWSDYHGSAQVVSGRPAAYHP
jgi:hypothetical protein